MITDEQVEQFAIDWAPVGRPIDWEDYLARMERYLDVNLPDSMDDPQIRRIQRTTRRVVRERDST